MKPETDKGKRSRRPSAPTKASEAGYRQHLRDSTADDTATSTANQGRRPAEKRPSDTERHPDRDRQKVRVFHSFHNVTIDRDQSHVRIRAVKGEQATYMAIAE